MWASLDAPDVELAAFGIVVAGGCAYDPSREGSLPFCARRRAILAANEPSASVFAQSALLWGHQAERAAPDRQTSACFTASCTHGAFIFADTVSASER